VPELGSDEKLCSVTPIASACASWSVWEGIHEVSNWHSVKLWPGVTPGFQAFVRRTSMSPVGESLSRDSRILFP
jgi:hypothetical protein